jgi:hypothetical protein
MKIYLTKIHKRFVMKNIKFDIKKTAAKAAVLDNYKKFISFLKVDYLVTRKEI